MSRIANTMRRRGAITTIPRKFAAVHVSGYTMGGSPLCLITTAALLLWARNGLTAHVRQWAEPMVWGYERDNTPCRRPAWRRP